jgi:hypothetical protein
VGGPVMQARAPARVSSAPRSSMSVFASSVNASMLSVAIRRCLLQCDVVCCNPALSVESGVVCCNPALSAVMLWITLL